MRDQAEGLRERLERFKTKSETKAIAVVSGKGGVGKSNFSLNFGLGLAQTGAKVLIFDLDFGMGNIDILMGVSPKHSIMDFFESDLPLTEIVENGPENLFYIAAGTGLTKFFTLDYEKFNVFMEQLQILFEDYQYIIFDMSAGATEDSLQFALAANELFVVTTPEPTSITDAYAMIKYFCLKEKSTPIYLLVNRVHSEKEAINTQNRLANVIKQFLKKEVIFLGDLPDDKIVTKAVRRQIPFLIFDPNSNVSRAMTRIVKRYSSKAFGKEEAVSSFNFISKLKRYFIER